MGIYLNPGNENFRRDTSMEIYVDKTMMIEKMNNFIDRGNNYVCISRPRRFGKTMAGNMLSSYYSKGCDSKELFLRYKIAQTDAFESKLNRYNVIKIDVNSEYQNTRNRDDLIDILSTAIIKEMQEQFPDVNLNIEDSLAMNLLKAYTKTGETFIIIMDEYDVLVREQVSKTLFDRYLSFLNGLFKSDTVRPAISLAYLTGILPVVRDRIQSKLNNFEEYTILDAGVLAEYVGFTSEEVIDLCSKYDVDYEECKRWYNGYSQHGYEIYNPRSVIKAIDTKRFGNYWSQTSTYQAIADRLEQNFEGTKDSVIQMISGQSVDVKVTTYMNTMTDFSSSDDLLTYLIHIGYLAYDLDDGTCHIPNKEIRDEWISAIAHNNEYRATDRIIKASRQLLEDTIAGDGEAVARSLDASHIHVSSNRSYNNEDVLQSAIYLSYIYALNQYTVVKEMTSGKGFADMVFIPLAPDTPAMIIELKRNSSTKTALDQIKNKTYFDSLEHYSGNLLFVGINYDETDKTHSCKIERFVKQ